MRKVKPAHNLHQDQPDNQQPTDSPLRLQQVNGAEVTPEEKPLPPPPPQFNKPVGPPPPPAEAPRGFDAIFATAVAARTGRPGMAEFWAQMAQADALNRVARELHRTNEYLGVYDNDDSTDPEEESTRLGDVLVDAVINGVMGSVEELIIFLPPEQQAIVEAALKKNAEKDEEDEDEVQKQRDRDGYPKKA